MKIEIEKNEKLKGQISDKTKINKFETEEKINKIMIDNKTNEIHKDKEDNNKINNEKIKNEMKNFIQEEIENKTNELIKLKNEFDKIGKEIENLQMYSESPNKNTIINEKIELKKKISIQFKNLFTEIKEMKAKINDEKFLNDIYKSKIFEKEVPLANKEEIKANIYTKQSINGLNSSYNSSFY